MKPLQVIGIVLLLASPLVFIGSAVGFAVPGVTYESLTAVNVTVTSTVFTSSYAPTQTQTAVIPFITVTGVLVPVQTGGCTTQSSDHILCVDGMSYFLYPSLGSNQHYRLFFSGAGPALNANPLLVQWITVVGSLVSAGMTEAGLTAGIAVSSWSITSATSTASTTTTGTTTGVTTDVTSTTAQCTRWNCDGLGFVPAVGWNGQLAYVFTSGNQAWVVESSLLYFALFLSVVGAAILLLVRRK